MVRIRVSDVADWFNCRSQTSFTVLFLVRRNLFLISVYKTVIGAFPCSLTDAPKQSCDQTACEPPSEETDRPILLARFSEICLQGAVLFLNIGFGVEEGLWSRQCSKGHRVPISSLISVAAPLFFLSHLWSWNSSSHLLLMAWTLLVLLFSF